MTVFVSAGCTEYSGKTARLEVDECFVLVDSHFANCSATGESYANSGAFRCCGVTEGRKTTIVQYGETVEFYDGV
jgi:hypothetical protein